MATGQMRHRVVFQSQSKVDDGGGGASRTWVDALTVWGHLRLTSGAERLAAGRPEASVSGVLKIRMSSETAVIDESYRVQVENLDYQIRSIINRDRKDRFIEMDVTRGVAM